MRHPPHSRTHEVVRLSIPDYGLEWNGAGLLAVLYKHSMPKMPSFNYWRLTFSKVQA